jgi:hypothetical protein
MAERAIGSAKVDTSFLSQIQPNVGGVQQAMETVALKESEKASQEAAAQAALQQAGVLMAQAAQKDREVKLASEAAQREVLASRSAVASQATNIIQEKEALASKDKIGAEIEARGAAKAKAEESAAAEASRIAAMEAAEADAMMKVAQAKKLEAERAAAELAEKKVLSQSDAAAATQRAADLTASSEAHSREAKLAEQQLHKTDAVFNSLEKNIATSGTSGLAAGVVPATVTSTVVGHEAAKVSSSGGLGATSAPIAKPVAQQQCCAVSGVSEWNRMHTVVRAPKQPIENAFPYILQIRILHADFGTAAAPMPEKVLVRIRSGDVEGHVDRLLDTRPGSLWNLEGSIPVRDPKDLVHITLIDGTGFEKTGMWNFNWDSARVLGQLFLNISRLVDGHQSMDNKLRLDGIGGILPAILHLERWAGCTETSSHARTGTGISDLPRHGGRTGYGWQRRGDESSNTWVLNHQSTLSSSGIGAPGIAPGSARLGSGGAPVSGAGLRS